MIELSGAALSGIVAVAFMAGYGFALLVQFLRNKMP
jgi:nitrate reductase NapE component